MLCAEQRRVTTCSRVIALLIGERRKRDEIEIEKGRKREGNRYRLREYIPRRARSLTHVRRKWRQRRNALRYGNDCSVCASSCVTRAWAAAINRNITHANDIVSWRTRAPDVCGTISLIIFKSVANHDAIICDAYSIAHIFGSSLSHARFKLTPTESRDICPRVVDFGTDYISEKSTLKMPSTKGFILSILSLTQSFYTKNIILLLKKIIIILSFF